MSRLLIIALFVFSLTSCQEGPFYEKNSNIPDQLWGIGIKPEFQIDVQDNQAKYDLFVNLRHTPYYPYSDFSFRVNLNRNALQDSSKHYELKMADADGRWIGNSAGNLYEQSLLIKENFVFPDTGKYIFTVEHNMIDNPLPGINDVGINIIKK